MFQYEELLQKMTDKFAAVIDEQIWQSGIFGGTKEVYLVVSAQRACPIVLSSAQGQIVSV